MKLLVGLGMLLLGIFFLQLAEEYKPSSRDHCHPVCIGQ